MLNIIIQLRFISAFCLDLDVDDGNTASARANARHDARDKL